MMERLMHELLAFLHLAPREENGDEARIRELEDRLERVAFRARAQREMAEFEREARRREEGRG